MVLTRTPEKSRGLCHALPAKEAVAIFHHRSGFRQPVDARLIHFCRSVVPLVTHLACPVHPRCPASFQDPRPLRGTPNAANGGVRSVGHRPVMDLLPLPVGQPQQHPRAVVHISAMSVQHRTADGRSASVSAATATSAGLRALLRERDVRGCAAYPPAADGAAMTSTRIATRCSNTPYAATSSPVPVPSEGTGFKILAHRPGTLGVPDLSTCELVHGRRMDHVLTSARAAR